MNTTAVRSPEEYEYAYEATTGRGEEVRAVRAGEKEVSDQAAIVARYADLFTRQQLDSLREAEEAVADPDDANGSTGCGGPARGLVDAEIAGTQDELENALLAARLTFEGEELPLRPARRSSPSCPTTRSAKSSVSSPRLSTRASTTTRRSSSPPARSSRPSSRARRRGRAERGREADLAARARGRARGARRGTAESFERLRERWFERLLGPERGELPVERAPPLVAPALAARVDVHEGACRRGLPRDVPCPRLRPRGDPEHPARPRGPAAEEPARLRDRVRPAGGRPPDHACAGRPLRLRGVPARGRPRAPLRGLRPAPSLYLPRAFARPRADGDLLLHRRRDHGRARLARRILRSL